MATSQYTNNATTTLAGALSSGVLSFSVAATSGTLFPTLTGSNYFYATIIDSANVIEVVKVTARVGDVMTVVRAQDGTSSPTTFASASRFELRVVAASMADKANIDGSNVATATWANLSIGGNAATATTATTATNLAATLAIASGGTGATTAQGARSTIGVGVSDQNIKSADYTLALTDIGWHILHPSADTTARSFTIPTNATVAFPIGSSITIVNQITAGNVTIYCNDIIRMAGTTGTGARTLVANGMATLLKITATEWIISGVGLT